MIDYPGRHRGNEPSVFGTIGRSHFILDAAIATSLSGFCFALEEMSPTAHPMINQTSRRARQEKCVAEDRNPAINASPRMHRAAPSLLFLQSTRHIPGAAPSSPGFECMHDVGGIPSGDRHEA
jgi:hypothetical protein